MMSYVICGFVIFVVLCGFMYAVQALLDCIQDRIDRGIGGIRRMGGNDEEIHN